MQGRIPGNKIRMMERSLTEGKNLLEDEIKIFCLVRISIIRAPASGHYKDEENKNIFTTYKEYSFMVGKVSSQTSVVHKVGVHQINIHIRIHLKYPLPLQVNPPSMANGEFVKPQHVQNPTRMRRCSLQITTCLAAAASPHLTDNGLK